MLLIGRPYYGHPQIFEFPFEMHGSQPLFFLSVCVTLHSHTIKGCFFSYFLLPNWTWLIHCHYYLSPTGEGCHAFRQGPFKQFYLSKDKSVKIKDHLSWARIVSYRSEKDEERKSKILECIHSTSASICAWEWYLLMTSFLWMVCEWINRILLGSRDWGSFCSLTQILSLGVFNNISNISWFICFLVEFLTCLFSGSMEIGNMIFKRIYLFQQISMQWYWHSKNH